MLRPLFWRGRRATLVDKMSDARLLAFSRALADSVHSGLPLAATLRSLSKVSLRDLKLAAAADMVSQGKTLHESLGAQGLFPPILIALIRAGEESGKVDEFLDRFAASLESRIDFRRRLNRALVYPAFTAGLAGAIFLLFSTMAAPVLLQPLVDAGVAAPVGALRIIRVGEFLIARWPWLLGTALAAAAGLWAFAQSSPGRKARALAGHWLPGARFATEEARFYQFEATLELLLGAGLRPRQIMEILLQYFRDDPVTYRRLSRGALMLSQGKGFSESIGACLPLDDRPRVAVAETAGRLDEALGKLARGHRDQHLHRLKLTASAVQIASVVALAPLCFGLIMWILWPTMSMLRTAGSQLTGIGASIPGGDFPAPPPVERTGGRATPPVFHPVETAAAARFNESSARKVVDYMQSHLAGDAGSGDDARSAKKKPVPMLKLKPRPSMGKLQFKKIQPSSFKSTLD